MKTLTKWLIFAFFIQGSLDIYAIQESKPIWVTIFIHGIMNIKPHINVNNFIHFMCDEVENTIYAKTVDCMRKNSFFYQNQPMQNYGLQAINQQLTIGDASAATAHLYKMVETMTNLDQDYEDHLFYTYGWSGLLSAKKRLQESQQLFDELCALKREIELTYNKKPKFRIIGYSHGGNVALNLGVIAQNYPKKKITIDELILIGTPIQHETDYLVCEPIFKDVYNVYSQLDRIQKSDFFSFHRFFSGKTFESRKDFIVPKNVHQIRIRISQDKFPDRPLSLKQHLQNLGQRRRFRDKSPGHIELWFYGWTPSKYRKNFPLAPLPITILLSHIIAQLKALHEIPTRCTFELRPEHAISIIRAKDKLFPQKFLSKKQLEQLKQITEQIMPKKQTKNDYEEQIAQAFATVQQEQQSNKRK
jgi:hypothetical protein